MQLFPKLIQSSEGKRMKKRRVMIKPKTYILVPHGG